METNGLLLNVYQWLPEAEQQRRDGQQIVWALFAGWLKCSISCLWLRLYNCVLCQSSYDSIY